MAETELPERGTIEAPKKKDNEMKPGCAVAFFGVFMIFGLFFCVMMISAALTDPTFNPLGLFFLVIPLIFVGIGIGGIVWALKRKGKSSEQVAFEQHKQRVEGPSSLLPEIKTEPGQTLAHQLERHVSDKAKVIGCLLVALFWNGIVSVMFTEVVESWMKGKPDYFLSVFSIPFVLVGLGLIVGFFHSLLVAIGVGPTTVEVSEARLRPGERFDFYLSQAGSMQINELKVRLVCEEKATYRVGTSTRTDTEVVDEVLIAVKENLAIHRGQPFEIRETVTVPATAMHSFKATRNEIVWRIEAKGDIARWPDFDRNFHVLVKAEEPVKPREGSK